MYFDNTYANLPKRFFAAEHPVPVANPTLLLWNEELAAELGVDLQLQESSVELGMYFSGSKILPGSEPIALAYAGHQFGHFVPQLGDGRAHLLGEVIGRNEQRRDIQLKGSGRTSFSRGGDGRCALGPAIREYIMSEAMFALGIPTTRSLAVVETGEPVYRDGPLPGAVVTRVASSHIRVGTFEYFAARRDKESLKTLCDYTIARHYPELADRGDDRYLFLLKEVIARQITLMVAWQRVGFIHGVMNTDNCAISGETIDYGPCAMLGVYDPATVYSSIDRRGRYAFGNQPKIAQWNMARLADCLVPLVANDEAKAIAILEPIIVSFEQDYESAFDRMLASKLGFETVTREIAALGKKLLQHMQESKLDYTITFANLGDGIAWPDEPRTPEGLEAWKAEWSTLLSSSNTSPERSAALMQANNPLVIPRNHHCERILAECQAKRDMSEVTEFIEVLKSPYTLLPNTRTYQDPPRDGDRDHRTFCGT